MKNANSHDASPNSRPIGLFDSGVGGLTVWREVAKRLPNEDLVYVADQAHCPYGVRPPAEIRELSRRVVDFLLQQDAKVIVVACNTASAAALDFLRESFPVPFVGMEPAVKPAAQASHARKIGILATRGTLDGSLFARTRARFARNLDVTVQTGDGLVEKIEAGDLDSHEMELLLRRYVEPMRAAGVDEIVLGCTHYPFVAPLIQKIAGPDVTLVDPNSAVARQVERVIEAHGCRNLPSHAAQHCFFTTGDREGFARALQKLIGLRAPVDHIP